LRYAQKPHTFFKNIYEVIGNWKLDLGDVSKAIHHFSEKQSFYFYAPKSVENPDIQKIEDLLMQAVQCQWVADVPIGIFLSGGVDSTLLLALAQELGHEHIPVFSITNSAQEKSFGTEDYRYARLAAQQFKADYQEINIESSMLNDMEGWVAQLDQPIADTAMLLTCLIAQKAKESVKVVLSGAGADEVFGGYHRHGAFEQYLKYRRFFTFLLPLLKWGAWLLPDGFAHPYRKQSRLWKKFLQQLHKNPTQTFINFTKMQNSISSLEQHGLLDLSESFLEYEQQTYLSADILKLSDNMPMLHSLELRVPYLDNDLLNYMNQFTPQSILKNGKKHHLKTLLNQRGGQLYTARPKEGFGIPFGGWIRQQTHQNKLDILRNPHQTIFEYVDYACMQKMLSAHLQQKADFTSEIWALWILSLWLKQQGF
jgi:asparagine synthase (glutamine-hydrolysing)